MDKKAKTNDNSLATERQLVRTTNRIKRARKDAKIAEKEAAEFEEIHKILEGTEKELSPIPELKPVVEGTDQKLLEYCIIPLATPEVKVFNVKSVFSLFNKDSLKLKNFVESEKDLPLIFGINDSLPSEDCFRKLITYHVAENLTPDEEPNANLNLYILYLMSADDKPAFVAACFDFLVSRPFRLQSKHIFPILINFGADLGDRTCDTDLLKKLSGDDGDFKGGNYEKKAFPSFNVEMVGKLLVHYVTGNFIATDSETKYLVKALTKITLDPHVKSGSLLPIYSILLSRFIERVASDFGTSEVVDWLHFSDEHLMNQLEICRMVSQAVCPKLHDALIFKTIRTILKSKSLPRHPKSMIEFIKLTLKKIKYKELSPLQLYCVFQLINSSLPGVTATVDDSVEVNKTLTYLESKIVQTEDSVDLIRLKLELAKARNLVTNNVNNRFSLEAWVTASSHKR